MDPWFTTSSCLYSDLLEEKLGIPRQPNEVINQFHMDLASSIQSMYEEAFLIFLISSMP